MKGGIGPLERLLRLRNPPNSFYLFKKDRNLLATRKQNRYKLTPCKSAIIVLP